MRMNTRNCEMMAILLSVWTCLAWRGTFAAQQASPICGAAVAGEAAERVVARPLKVLMIGNSFSRPVVFNLPKLAREAGMNLDIASLYNGGCPLERHVKNLRAGKKS